MPDQVARAGQQLMWVLQQGAFVETQVQVIRIDRQHTKRIPQFLRDRKHAGQGMGMVQQFIAVRVQFQDISPQIAE